MVPTVSNPELFTAEEVIEEVAHLAAAGELFGPDVLQAVAHENADEREAHENADERQEAHENADERQEAHENADERQEAVPVAQENADEGVLTSAQGEAQPSGVQSE